MYQQNELPSLRLALTRLSLETRASIADASSIVIGSTTCQIRKMLHRSRLEARTSVRIYLVTSALLLAILLPYNSKVRTSPSCSRHALFPSALQRTPSPTASPAWYELTSLSPVTYLTCD